MQSSLHTTLARFLAVVLLGAGACTATVRDFGEGGATTGSQGSPTGATAPSTGALPTTTQGPGSTGANMPGATTTTTTTGEGSASTGTTPQPQGSPCSSSDGCESGFCVDGVCCDTDCPQACGACTAAKKGGGEDGVCGAIAAGGDPDGECPDTAPASCGTTGTCNGAFSCTMFAGETMCAPGSCSGNQIIHPDFCNGSGACADGGTADCGSYACQGAVCLGSCSSDAGCFNGTFCRANGTCGPRDVLGTSCSGPADCQSGFCTDGVCCDGTCDGECVSCNWSTPGTCSLIESGDPDNECPGNQICCSGGFCSFPQQCLAVSPK